MRRIWLMLAVLLAPAMNVHGAHFFVSPTGTTNGAGSVVSPWDFETASHHPAAVKPGDTIWLRGGVYLPSSNAWPAFESSLGGASNAPIIVRAYPGERPILREHPQYVGTGGQTILYVFGSNTWFWGLEVASISTARITSVAGPNPSASELRLPSGVQVRGGNIKLINLIIHDTRGGLGLWQEATNCEVSGCLVYNNGWKELNGGGHGHGAYCQNSNGVMRLRNNIIFNQFANGIQGFTANSQVRNLHVERNAVFGNARIANFPQNDTGPQFVFGGGARIENLKIVSNCLYQSLSMNGVTIRTDFGQNSNSDATVVGNYIAGGSGGGNFQTTATFYDSVVFSNNTAYTTNGGFLHLTFQAQTNYVVDANTYYGNGSFNNNGTSYSFPSWKTATGFDANSIQQSNPSPPNVTYVFPDPYEPRRANIIVYNWGDSNNVSVNVSSVLSSGDVYEVRNAQDYFSSPVLTGTYIGASLSLPMTNLTTVAPNGWTNTAAVPTTGKQFNVFVLTGAPSSIPPQSFPLNPYVQVLDGQWQGIKFASDGNCYFASSTHDNKHGAAFFRYQPDIKVLTMLTNDITRVCGEDPTVTPPQGKIHSDIVEHNGWLYFATHIANYWTEAKNAYTGAHVVGYELATGAFRDFGVIRSNHTIYAGIGLDPIRNKLIVYTTRDWGSPPGSYVYRIDIGSGTNEFLGAVQGNGAFWFFVDTQGDCWISPWVDNGSLLRVRSATGQIDRWANVQPADDVQGDRYWAWAQPLPDGDRCVFRLQAGNNLYIFDAAQFRTNSATGFSVVQNIGPYGLGLALGQDRVFYIQRANRQEGQQEFQDFHLFSVSLATNVTPVILDHGLIVDQSGRLVWRIPGMAADASNRVYMVGDWWLLPGEQGSPTGTLRHVDGPGTNYTAVVRGEFFAVTKVSIVPPPPPPPPLSSNGYSQAVTSANPVAYWRFNESNGATVAIDSIGFHNGTINAGVTAGASGPQSPPFLGFETNNPAMQLNAAANSYLTMPTLNLNTNTVTITGWINPTGFQVGWAGIAFCRSNSTIAGLNFGPGTIPNELRYHWNDSQWNISTGLAAPTNQWSFVALVVTPTNATIYLGTNGVLSSFTDTVNHLSEAFDGSLRIGSDSASDSRLFKGKLDEIAIFKRSLTPAQIQQLYAAALTAPPALTPFQTWQFQYFGCTNCTGTEATADPDGDGQNNSAEFLTGTNPTNNASSFRIISVVHEDNDIRVTWQTAGGKTNALQFANGDYTTNFTDLGGTIVVSGAGDAITNRVDTGVVTNVAARYYRVRLVP